LTIHDAESPMHRSRRALTAPVVAMVSDRHRYGGNEEEACEAFISAARRAASAGVDLIQIRERGLDDRQLLALATRVRAVLSGTGSQTLVNDRTDVALAAGVDGVHLPARAISAASVRPIVPDGFLIGRSVHSEAEAVDTERAGGCDYLIFGSVFESTSKARGHAVAGLDALARTCSRVQLPVLAIGGITLAHLPAVVRAGASGVAAIGLFALATEQEFGETVWRIRLAFDLKQR
jgi:thiamine-phosphate pyrophosphorylase